MRRRLGARAALALVAALAGCAVQYDLKLMPRDSGRVTYGTAVDLGNGSASVTIAVDDTVYTGTWVMVTPQHVTDYVGASTWGWRQWGAYGPVDRIAGGAVAKALLQAADGRGMRCDFFGLTGGTGSGSCTDDKALSYDVQITSRNPK